MRERLSAFITLRVSFVPPPEDAGSKQDVFTELCAWPLGRTIQIPQARRIDGRFRCRGKHRPTLSATLYACLVAGPVPTAGSQRYILSL